MYVELYGKAQDQSVPDKVRLKLKPLSRSYFRIGDQIKDLKTSVDRKKNMDGVSGWIYFELLY